MLANTNIIIGPINQLQFLTLWPSKGNIFPQCCAKYFLLFAQMYLIFFFLRLSYYFVKTVKKQYGYIFTTSFLNSSDSFNFHFISYFWKIGENTVSLIYFYIYFLINGTMSTDLFRILLDLMTYPFTEITKLNNTVH